MPLPVVRSFSSSGATRPLPTKPSTNSSQGIGSTKNNHPPPPPTNAINNANNNNKLPSLPLRVWNKNNSYSFGVGSGAPTADNKLVRPNTTANTSLVAPPSPTPTRAPTPPRTRRGRSSSPAPLAVATASTPLLGRFMGRRSSRSRSRSRIRKANSKGQVPPLITPEQAVEQNLPLRFVSKQELQWGPLVGEGGFAQVFACSYLTASEEEAQKEVNNKDQLRFFPYAFKMIRPALLNPQAETSITVSGSSNHNSSLYNSGYNKHDKKDVAQLKKTKAINDFCHEVHTLVMLANESNQHSNIMTIRGLTTSATSQEEDLFFVLDRIHETLAERIDTWRQQKKQWKELQQLPSPEEQQQLMDKKLNYAHQMALALQHLHQRRILYRDLKPENLGFVRRKQLLLHSAAAATSSDNCGDNDNDEILQLFDFGMARVLPQRRPPSAAGTRNDNDVDDNDDDTPYDHLTICGTQRYMAPENLLLGQYTLKSDCYTWSMVVWETLACQKPFHYMTPNVHKILVCEKGDRPKVPSATPAYLKELLKISWSAQAKDRWSMAQICARMDQELQPRPPQREEKSPAKKTKVPVDPPAWVADDGQDSIITVAAGKNDATVVKEDTIPPSSPRHHMNSNPVGKNTSVDGAAPSTSFSDADRNEDGASTTSATSSTSSNNKAMKPPLTPVSSPTRQRQQQLRGTSSYVSTSSDDDDDDSEGKSGNSPTSTAVAAKSSRKTIPLIHTSATVRLPGFSTHKRTNSNGTRGFNLPSLFPASRRHKRSNSSGPALTFEESAPNEFEICSSNHSSQSGILSAVGSKANSKPKHKRSHSASISEIMSPDNDIPTTDKHITGNTKSGAALIAPPNTGTGSIMSPRNKKAGFSFNLWHRRTKAQPLSLPASPDRTNSSPTSAADFDPPSISRHQRTTSGSDIILEMGKGGDLAGDALSVIRGIDSTAFQSSNESILPPGIPTSGRAVNRHRRTNSGSTTSTNNTAISNSQGPKNAHPAQSFELDRSLPLVTPTFDNNVAKVRPVAPTKTAASYMGARATPLQRAPAMVSPIPPLSLSHMTYSFDDSTSTNLSNHSGGDGTGSNSGGNDSFTATHRKCPSFSELQRRKHDLKERLKQFDIAFARKHGRMPRKREKESIRPLYEFYNALKSYIAELETLKHQLRQFEIDSNMPLQEKEAARNLLYLYNARKREVAIFLNKHSEDHQPERGGGDSTQGRRINYYSLGSFDSFLSADGHVEVAEL